MMLDLPFWLPLAFFFVAMIYSMVGFAGGSSYLALLVLAGLPYKQVPPVALLCNLIVSASAFWHFYKGGHFDLKKALPFIVFSIPLAFLGGKMAISKELFHLFLGFSLFVAGARMLLPDKNFMETRPVSSKKMWLVGMPLGAALGFLSGLVGIGGGIFLSPFLLLMRWMDAKQTAAAASFFILVNSLSGLLGQMHKGAAAPGEPFLFLGLAVLLGGQFGARIGAYRLPRPGVQRITGLLILYVSFSLLGKVF
ncbi:MAG: sulfite exporter TauE/SafE family protein [Candidatus Omnitrophica bacterium]|nr:sulfite exporter TauE/SafE family protein [Candidatus Omnitrophota bacterium]